MKLLLAGFLGFVLCFMMHTVRIDVSYKDETQFNFGELSMELNSIGQRLAYIDDHQPNDECHTVFPTASQLFQLSRELEVEALND